MLLLFYLQTVATIYIYIALLTREAAISRRKTGSLGCGL
jgi:hypothetical protein